MNKFGPKAQREVEKAIHEMKQGKLKSGQSNQKVTSRKQAVAIGLSKARQAGGKVPHKQVYCLVAINTTRPSLLPFNVQV